MTVLARGVVFRQHVRHPFPLTLNPNRWAIIEALTGAGPLGVRELARRVGRDVKGVHTDAQALVLCGLIDKTRAGKLHFPYDAVHVDFTLKAA